MATTTSERPHLTKRQQQIYDFLKDKIVNRGYGPTVREIGAHCGIRSPNGVMCHLKALEKKGVITRESHRSRAIQLTKEWKSPTLREVASALRQLSNLKHGDAVVGSLKEFANGNIAGLKTKKSQDAVVMVLRGVWGTSGESIQRAITQDASAR